MVRPLRIEYENAYYHVMNRGKGRSQLFHGADYYTTFLKGLEEAHRRFGLEVHSYCLMGNHYHLLVCTPRGNLSRAMRHVNGLYTQRYNRMRQTDGPLFRGRYKAILIDASSYLLQVSRYIHRNPIETEKALVSKLEQYGWSSYPAYLNQCPAPEWLYRNVIYGELGSPQRYAAYRRYVDQGIDEDTAQFYHRSQLSALWGDKAFAERAYTNALSLDEEISRTGIQEPIAMNRIVKHVASHFCCSEESVYKARRGRGAPNIPRWVAMKLCQDYSGATLTQIGSLFGVGNYCTVSQTISRLKKLLDTDRGLMEQLYTISQDLTP
jgi:REP element-mobilizing transposase RayT